MKILPILVLAILWPFLVFSQNVLTGQVQGRVLDEDLRTGLYGATVSLVQAKDSSQTSYHVLCDSKGFFKISNVSDGNYLLYVTYLGYLSKLVPSLITIKRSESNLGEILLKRKSLLLAEIEISEHRIQAAIKKDTIEFNASFFKTKETSVMEALLKKIPGIEIMPDGTIKVNGEVVKKIMIDGHSYFGNDPKIASKNILAGMVDKVQLIDVGTDPGEFGVPSGRQNGKAINITIKKNQYDNLNGFTNIGYGTINRYSGKIALNKFSTNNQLSIIGGANNINGFAENMSLAGGAGDMADWNAGFNYNKDITRKFSFGINYLIDRSTSNAISKSKRQNFVGDSSTYYTQSSNTLNNTFSHSIELSVRYSVDSSSTFNVVNRFFYPIKKISLQNMYETNGNVKNPLNSGLITNNTKDNSLSYFTSIGYVKSFKKDGQILSMNFTNGNDIMSTKLINQSNTAFYLPDGIERQDTINQLNQQNVKNNLLQFSANYSQPIFIDKFIDISLLTVRSTSFTNRRAFNYSKVLNDYSTIIDSLEAQLVSISLSNTASLNYRNQKKNYDYSVGLNIVTNNIRSNLKNLDSTVNQHVANFFPSFSFNYLFSDKSRLHFDYFRTIQPPTASQLLPIVDNSNSLYIQKGNLNLKPTRLDYLTFSYKRLNPSTLKSMTIASSLGLFREKMINGVNVDSQGRQVTKPLNINGAYYFNTFMSNSFPVKKLSTIINTNTSINIEKDFTFVNGQIAKINRNVVSQSFVFNYMHKQIFDVSIFAKVDYSSIKYFFTPLTNINYFEYNISMDGNLYLPLGITLGTNLNCAFSSGRAVGYNSNKILLNALASKTLLRNQRGLIKCQVFDLFNRNNNNLRNAGGNYIEDIQSNPLQRFFMLSVTYFINKKNK